MEGGQRRIPGGLKANLQEVIPLRFRSVAQACGPHLIRLVLRPLHNPPPQEKTIRATGPPSYPCPPGKVCGIAHEPDGRGSLRAQG